MLRLQQIGTVLGALTLGACAVAPPSGPTIVALPAQGKTFEAFQQDDASCRQYAAQTTGGVAPAQAANDSFADSAAAGTVLGAAAGAAIGAATGGPAAGAAIGAATGLLFGSASGASAAGYSAAALQRSYDIAYVQCMSAKGESVPTATSLAALYPPGGYYAAYPYPYPYYPYYYGPAFTGGVFFAFHGRHGHFHHR
jgi:hypothetical protein